MWQRCDIHHQLSAIAICSASISWSFDLILWQRGEIGTRTPYFGLLRSNINLTMCNIMFKSCPTEILTSCRIEKIRHHWELNLSLRYLVETSIGATCPFSKILKIMDTELRASLSWCEIWPWCEMRCRYTVCIESIPAYVLAMSLNFTVPQKTLHMFQTFHFHPL